MTTIHSPADIIRILQDMEYRSQQDTSVHSEQDISHQSWAGIDFRLSQHRYLVAIDETREILPVPKQIAAVPKSEPWVFGVANLRGELLPIFDLNYFLSGQPSKVNKRSRIIVINHPKLSSGLLLDEVFGLKHFQQQPDDHNPHAEGTAEPFLNGSISQHEQHWDIFSFTKLATDPRFLNAAA